MDILLLNGCGMEAKSTVKVCAMACAGLAADSPK